MGPSAGGAIHRADGPFFVWTEGRAFAIPNILIARDTENLEKESRGADKNLSQIYETKKLHSKPSLRRKSIELEIPDKRQRNILLPAGEAFRVSRKNKPGAGRPSKLDHIDLHQVQALASFGLTDVQMAQSFGVTHVTFNAWKKKNAKFFTSLKNGKEIADKQVEVSLYKAACGYNHAEEKIFCSKDGIVTTVETIKHYPPDTTACIFWLCNRNRENWKNTNRHELTGKDGEPIKSQALPDLSKLDSETLAKLTRLSDEKRS